MICGKIDKRTIFFILLFILQLSIFWLGRFSAQLTTLESNLDAFDLANFKRRKSAQSILTSNVVNKEKPSTFLMIIIMTSQSDLFLRQTIRETWLRLSTKTPEQYRYIFPVGTKNVTETQLLSLKAEQRAMSYDIVLLNDIVEDYSRLSRKTAATIRYVTENFNFKFLLKVDSDSFVRLGAFLKALKDVVHPQLYWGFLDGRARPFRKGKWKELDWILCDRYLPYQLGGGYVISFSLANYIANNFKILRFYRSEDVAVGAWLSGLDIKYVHDPRFDTEFTSRGCHNEYLISHKQTPQAMRKMFARVRDTGMLCASEYRVRPSYIYDFSVPPSQCCLRKNNSAIP